MPQPKLETSWRLHYLWNASNATPFVPLATRSTRAGQAVHVNYAMSWETLARNRPEGYRVNLTLQRIFPHMPL